jgi:hypothetical protein
MHPKLGPREYYCEKNCQSKLISAHRREENAEVSQLQVPSLLEFRPSLADPIKVAKPVYFSSFGQNLNYIPNRSCKTVKTAKYFPVPWISSPMYPIEPVFSRF